MRFRTLVAAGLGAGLVAAPALADDGYRHGRVRFVEPGVTLQRATEASAEEAIANLPFLPGDRVWTDSAGRAEFQFPDGTVVRLDCRSKLDYAGHEEGDGERIVLRLWSGSAIVHVRTADFARFEVETPAGMVRALERAIVRVDVDAGETRVSVHAGEAELNDGRRGIRLAAGERTFARWGAEAEEPRRFDPQEGDDFARWDSRRDSEGRWAGRSSEYLPDELDAYAGEFETNGTWRQDDTVGVVWIPRVVADWQPYSNGRWIWTSYGWTWVPYEGWGWAPFHYGRWDYSDSWGWYWMAGNSWGPAWVSWAVGGGYVGWCPLGRHDRPVAAWGHHRGSTAVWGRHGHRDPWNVVRQGDLGGRDLHRRRVPADRVDSAALHVAEGVGLRPTRDAGSLREDGGAHAISRKMSAGDFVRELGPDNKTTIPAPWTRGYGPPPAGVEGARTGAQPRSDPNSEDRHSRGFTTNRGTGIAGASGAASGGSRGSEEGGASGRGSRPVPRFLSNPGDDADERSTPTGDGARRRSGDGSSGSYRPRSGGGGGASGGAQPRSSGGGASGGSYQPRSSGGGASGGAQPRSSGGGASGGSYQPRSSGGGASGGSYQPRSSGGGASGGSQPRSSGGGASGTRSGGGGGRSQGTTTGRSSSGGSSSSSGSAAPRSNHSRN